MRHWHIKVLPAFRPDNAMNVDDVNEFNNYLTVIEKSSNISISTYNDYLAALKKRHDYFVANSCRVSDHGLEEIYAEDYTDRNSWHICQNPIRRCPVFGRKKEI